MSYCHYNSHFYLRELLIQGIQGICEDNGIFVSMVLHSGLMLYNDEVYKRPLSMLSSINVTCLNLRNFEALK